MKKLGLIKRFSLTAALILLCLAVVATCFTFMMPPVGAPLAEYTQSSTAIELGSIKIEDSVDYGETFTVPAVAGTDVEVTAPNGDHPIPDAATGAVSANQIGNYKVTYSKDGISYDFVVRSRLKEEYKLKVAYNGAEIPTYLQVNGSFVLPDAQVVYYDEDNIERVLPDSEYTVTVTDSNGKSDYNVKSADPAAKTFTADSTAKRVFFTYSAKVGDGTKTLTQTFTVNVQANVQSTGNPTLSVSGVQRDVSINRAVTLPKATATDSYDENVQVIITVIDPVTNEPVKNVDIDDDGYAVENADYGPVQFDNDKVMTFYPTHKGSYKVTYVAVSDVNKVNPDAGKSSVREYYMTVSDLVAPVFKSLDDHTIPETWGMNVYGKESGVKLASSGKITFTVPEVVDNYDHAYPVSDEDADLISVYFRITDSDTSKPIVEFTNILDTKGENNKFTRNSVYGQKIDPNNTEAIIFDKDHPFTFDFADYARKNSDNSDKALPGTYTVLYRARDKANNTSSKTYTVTLQESYTDSADPTTAEVTVPDYISAADKTLTIPFAAVADASDSRLKKDYLIYTDADVSGTAEDPRSIKVDGGEKADIEEINNARYLIVNKDKSNQKQLKLGNNLYFYVAATDDAGNFKSNVKDNVDLLDPQTAATAYTDVIAVVKVLSSQSAPFEYSKTVPVVFSNADASKDDITAGDNVIASGFSITTGSYDMRNYTGFEVAVYDPAGNALNVTLETVNKKVTDTSGDVPVDTGAEIYVQNIKFNAAVATKDDEFYSMVVRVFDVNGNNSVYAYKLTGVQPSGNGNIETSAISAIGSTGNVNVTYKLNNEVIKGINGSADTRYFVVRKISGGIFSLMGSEFTAKTQGSYSVQDGYIDENDIDANGKFDFAADVKFAGANEGVYNFSITDSSAPVIEMQGTMPTYKPQYNESDTDEQKAAALVKLPKVVAYTENGVAEVEVEVKDPDAYDVDLNTETDGSKSFKGTKNGAYTVTYTATYKNASPVTATYTINIGDVFAPQFTVTAPSTATMRVGDTFTFSEMTLAEGEETGNVTITKKLIDPSHEEVSGATVSGSYNNKRLEKNNGTDITFNMAGTYEVVYTATDSVGNPSTQRFTITVVSSGSSTPTTWTTLSTVLIIVAVVLLAGVIVYVVRFRKVKK